MVWGYLDSPIDEFEKEHGVKESVNVAIEDLELEH